MSKASNWAVSYGNVRALQPASLRLETVSADVSADGGLTISTPPGASAIESADALQLARWILDTYE